MKNVLGVFLSFILPSGELESNFAANASSSPGNFRLWKSVQEGNNQFDFLVKMKKNKKIKNEGD